jgi:hypothetical protein
MSTEPPQHITDWIRFKAFLDSLITFTEGLVKDLDQKPTDYEYRGVLFQFIVRFHLNFVAINNIWKEFLNNSKFKHPVYLLLRSLISDYINMVYLVDGLKFQVDTMIPDETEFFARYTEISNAYFARIDKLSQDLISTQVISPADRDRFLRVERDSFPEHFEGDETIRVKKGLALDPGALIKRLKKSDFKELTGVYQYYFYFSQHDHFSKKAEELLYKDRNEEFRVLVGAVNYLVRGLLLNINIMNLSNDVSGKLEKIIQDFDSKFFKDKPKRPK